MSILPAMTSASPNIRLTISEVAQRLGVTSRALRHYEDMGLITSQRATRSTRTYDLKTVLELETIVLLREVDVSIPAIAQVMAQRAEPQAFASAMREALNHTLEQKRRGIAMIQQLLEDLGPEAPASTDAAIHEHPRSGRFMRAEEHVDR